MGTSKIQFLFFPPFVQGEGNEEAPGSKTGKVNDKVEVPFIVRGMLGNRGPQHIVDTDKIQEEIISMKIAHGAVPGAGDEGEEKEAGQKVHMHHFFQILFVKKEKQAGKARQKDAYRSLGEDCQGSRYIAEEIVFPVFRIAQIEKGNGGAHEKEEGGVRNHCLGQYPAFH